MASLCVRHQWCKENHPNPAPAGPSLSLFPGGSRGLGLQPYTPEIAEKPCDPAAGQAPLFCVAFSPFHSLSGFIASRQKPGGSWTHTVHITMALSAPHSLKASHLFQLKNRSDVWLDAPLLTVLKSRGQAPGEDRKVLVPVSAPVHSHGRDILQEQKIGRNRSNGSSTKANHHNPALPGQAEGKKEKKL